jgi:predicted transposase YbfD/YdcC
MKELMMPKRKTLDKKFTDLQKEIDLEKFLENIKSNFKDLSDPRIDNRCTYPMWYLFLVILSGYLAGCNTIADIAHFAELRACWFADLTGQKLPAPSYDTFWWFFVRVKPKVFKELIVRWLQGLSQDLKDQLLAIDGKRLRGVSDNEHISHIVELFATEGRLVIAQEKVRDKAGEAQALPALLNAFDITGAIISMDALYANVGDINKVVNSGADYIVGIKGNQPNLEAEVHNFFEQANAINYEGVEGFTQVETHEKGHGRTERRCVSVVNELDWLPQREEWHLQSLIEVRSERVIGDKVELATRYYGSSRKADAKKFVVWVREHWGIENGLHYVMDVVFKEDASLSDVGHSAENMSLIRRLATNIISTFDPERGITDARRNATYEPNYLRGLLGKVFVK